MKKKNRFHQMCKESLISEELIRDFFNSKYQLQFHLVPTEEQLALSHTGLHVADMLCVEKPNVAFEIKEDILSAKTGNIAFEISCLTRLRRWGHGEGIQHIYLLYVNHKDYCLDVFELGMYDAKLDLELKSLSEKNKACRIVSGGDQMHPMYILPISLARTLNSCLSDRFFCPVEQFFFSKAAKSVLKR